MDEVLSQAERDIAVVTPSPSTATAYHRMLEGLKQGQALLEECQKFIRLADRSEHGYGVVEAYMAIDLAKDSDHERRIEKTERSAERKAAQDACGCRPHTRKVPLGPLLLPNRWCSTCGHGSARSSCAVPPAVQQQRCQVVLLDSDLSGHATSVARWATCTSTAPPRCRSRGSL